MINRRQKDAQWQLNLSATGTVTTADAQLAVLMDVRDELKLLNALLRCDNFLAIPRKLDDIRRNTAKKRRKKQ